MVKTWVVVNLECGKNVVVPMKFIHTFERWSAYNRRINRNHVYLVFFSRNVEQRPRFHLQKRITFSETEDACYYGKLVQCFGSLAEANKFAEGRRTMPPALYNERRLKEKPTPLLVMPTQNETNNNPQMQLTTSSTATSSTASIVPALRNITNTSSLLTMQNAPSAMLAAIFQELSRNFRNEPAAVRASTSNGAICQNRRNERETATIEEVFDVPKNSHLDQNISDQSDTATDQELFDAPIGAHEHQDDSELNLNLMLPLVDEIKSEDEEVPFDDDVELLTPFDEVLVHKPHDTKYDTLTGYIPFTVSENGARSFKVKNKKYLLTKSTIGHLKSFNTNPALQNNVAYDRTFVNTILVSFINVSKLKNFETEDEAMQLIRELYSVRVKGDADRLDKLDVYVNDKCAQLSQKY